METISRDAVCRFAVGMANAQREVLARIPKPSAQEVFYNSGFTAACELMGAAFKQPRLPNPVSLVDIQPRAGKRRAAGSAVTPPASAGSVNTGR